MENLEEYQNPAEYDCENGGYGPAGPFYEALARESGGPVLELACGTGRIAIPLARLGFDVTGLDIVPGMIEQARAKSAGLRIEWVVGDCCDFRLDRRFGLAFMTGHAFQHFLDRSSQEAMLARVREHLAPGGIFAFETRNPRLAELHANYDEEPWHTFKGPDGQLVEVSGFQSYDHASQIQTYTTHRRSGGEVRTTRIQLRYTWPQELEALLHYNGFIIEQMYGNWDRSPVTAESVELICVCRVI